MWVLFFFLVKISGMLAMLLGNTGFFLSDHEINENINGDLLVETDKKNLPAWEAAGPTPRLDSIMLIPS